MAKLVVCKSLLRSGGRFGLGFQLFVSGYHVHGQLELLQVTNFCLAHVRLQPRVDHLTMN